MLISSFDDSFLLAMLQKCSNCSRPNDSKRIIVCERGRKVGKWDAAGCSLNVAVLLVKLRLEFGRSRL